MREESVLLKILWAHNTHFLSHIKLWHTERADKGVDVRSGNVCGAVRL